MRSTANASRTSQGERTVVVPVSGMTCSACERRVTRALSRLPGVDLVQVSATRGRATLTGRDLPERDRIDAAIRRAGYEPAAPRWLSDDASVWRHVVVAALAVAAVGWVAWSVGLSGLPSRLAAPTGGGLLLVLILGLTAGVSTCMAMVGGLVLAVSASHAARGAVTGAEESPLATRLRPYVVFNLGRVVGFALLGALLGAAGGVLSPPARVTASLAVAVALVMLLLGVRLTGVSPRLEGWTPRLPAGLGRLLGVDRAADRAYSDARAASLGAATFFLPCGFTQAVQLYALSTGRPLTAALVMGVFALGTTPGLLALSSVPEMATGGRRVAVLRFVGVVVVAFALLNLAGGLRVLGVDIGADGSAAAVESAGRKASANVSVAGGVQTVTMTQTPRGYDPADTVVYSGIPIRWTITGTSSYDCSAYIESPDLGVSIRLQDGANVLDLPALEPGSYTFTCVMGMYSGHLVAVPPPAGDVGVGTAARG